MLPIRPCHETRVDECGQDFLLDETDDAIYRCYVDDSGAAPRCVFNSETYTVELLTLLRKIRQEPHLTSLLISSDVLLRDILNIRSADTVSKFEHIFGHAFSNNFRYAMIYFILSLDEMNLTDETVTEILTDHYNWLSLVDHKSKVLENTLGALPEILKYIDELFFEMKTVYPEKTKIQKHVKRPWPSLVRTAWKVLKTAAVASLVLAPISFPSIRETVADGILSVRNSSLSSRMYHDPSDMSEVTRFIANQPFSSFMEESSNPVHDATDRIKRVAKEFLDSTGHEITPEEQLLTFVVSDRELIATVVDYIIDSGKITSPRVINANKKIREASTYLQAQYSWGWHQKKDYDLFTLVEKIHTKLKSEDTMRSAVRILVSELPGIEEHDFRLALDMFYNLDYKSTTHIVRLRELLEQDYHKYRREKMANLVPSLQTMKSLLSMIPIWDNIFVTSMTAAKDKLVNGVQGMDKRLGENVEQIRLKLRKYKESIEKLLNDQETQSMMHKSLERIGETQVIMMALLCIVCTVGMTNRLFKKGTKVMPSGITSTFGSWFYAIKQYIGWWHKSFASMWRTGTMPTFYTSEGSIDVKTQLRQVISDLARAEGALENINQIGRNLSADPAELREQLKQVRHEMDRLKESASKVKATIDNVFTIEPI